jgi:bloom syndrome protein
VPSTFLSSQQTSDEARRVHQELCKARPSMKMLYVTPEQLVNSSSLISKLQGLCKAGLLARFVVDEVSEWLARFVVDEVGGWLGGWLASWIALLWMR